MSPSNSAGAWTHNSSSLSPLEASFQKDFVDLEAQGWEDAEGSHTFGLVGGER